MSSLQDEISKLNKSIDEKRAAIESAEKMPKPLGSAFIQCNLQMGAHVLAQCVSYHEVRHISFSFSPFLLSASKTYLLTSTFFELSH